jgi:hypothetical protein
MPIITRRYWSTDIDSKSLGERARQVVETLRCSTIFDLYTRATRRQISYLQGYGPKTVAEIARLLRSQGLSMRNEGEVAVRGLYRSSYAHEHRLPIGQGDLYEVVEVAVDERTNLPSVVYRVLSSDHQSYPSESLRVEWEIDFFHWVFSGTTEIASPSKVLLTKFD